MPAVCFVTLDLWKYLENQLTVFMNRIPKLIASISKVSHISSRTMAVDIGGMRKPYHDKSDVFDFQDLVSQEPFQQFKSWFEAASSHEAIYEANAMCLSTATTDGVPSARMVLLKKFGPEGFSFFTNYTSRKAQELDTNPRAALVFFWEPLNRSVRVEGTVTRLSEAESLEYFQSRPISSQIGACVSNQSQVIADRAVLTEKERELEAVYGEGKEDRQEVPKPDWGGYRVVPGVVEFWQGQSTRIHDRIRFRTSRQGEILDPAVSRQGEDGWIIERLAP